MRRLLVIGLILAAAAGVFVATSAVGDDGGGKPLGTYTVELDNAFGVVEGADVKVAGVRAGKVATMDVDRKTHRALIGVEITEPGFESLREDVFCQTRPQSLIGEYFIDCLPGKSPRKLPPGARIPVDHTASTVPIDLINNVMRRPYRERLAIILGELGAGVGGRADQLNETIRRAVPALRETDQVLALLAEQNQVLADLTRDADTVIGDLSENRRDVGRWVRETKETAAASAERREDIRGSLARLPGFLRELKPTMAALGETADAQHPMLENLNASADQLERALVQLGPFSEASNTAFKSLARASEEGRPAVKAATPTVEQLKKFATDTPELANNLDIVLDHLDDRRFAVEKDPRSPGGQGYTGLEAFLQYLYDQALAINIFDTNSYILKVNLFASECSEFQNAQSLREHEAEHPGFYERCAARLGPSQPGITTPDETYTGRQAAKQEEAEHGPLGGAAGGKSSSSSSSKDDKPKPDTKLVDQRSRGGGKSEAQKRIEDALGVDLPDLLPKGGPAPPGGGAGGVGGTNVPTPQQAQQLLDFLLAP